MLSPKRVKFRRVHRGRKPGMSRGQQRVEFGEYGLKALEAGWLTNRQIEAARIAMTRKIKRGGKVWINVYPDKPFTKKPAETRMGSGKGSPEGYTGQDLTSLDEPAQSGRGDDDDRRGGRGRRDGRGRGGRDGGGGGGRGGGPGGPGRGGGPGGPGRGGRGGGGGGGGGRGGGGRGGGGRGGGPGGRGGGRPDLSGGISR